jgi:HTH-type transcriptional regulator, sugar sensing transcriptional regulator
MINSEIYDLLKIGLTEGESKVYLALSELGSSTVGPIVKSSGVAYSNIYDILNRLIEKGIVSFIIKNKTKHFQAAAPGNLLKYLDEKEKVLSDQRQTLQKMLPSLEKIQQGKHAQEAEVFIGIKGLRTAYEKLLKNTSKNDEELFFYLHHEEYAEQSDIFYNSISHLMKSVKNRGICNQAYKNSWFAKKAKNLNIRFVKFPIPGNIDIIKDNVMIITWKPSPIAILIHSQTVADNFREYFNQVWDIGKK